MSFCPDLMHRFALSDEHSSINRWAIRLLPLIEKMARKQAWFKRGSHFGIQRLRLSDTVTPSFEPSPPMSPSACPAARLPEVDRKDLAILALAGTATISNLAAQHNVSRKFVYQQDDEALFALPVTKTWLRQLTLGLTLICHSSYRGVVELMRDLLGVSISEGTVHNVHQAAARQAGEINGARTCRRFVLACTTKSSRVPSPCWPASMPGRLTATCLPQPNIATPTPGAFICSTRHSRD